MAALLKKGSFKFIFESIEYDADYVIYDVVPPAHVQVVNLPAHLNAPKTLFIIPNIYPYDPQRADLYTAIKNGLVAKLEPLGYLV